MIPSKYENVYTFAYIQGKRGREERFYLILKGV